MNLEKVVFGFFVLLAATLNFGFFIGDISDPALHNVYELFAAVVVNLIATVLKFGDRTQIGAVHLATSLVADLQLIAAALMWGYADARLVGGDDRGRWRASCRCPGARCWPTSSRSCCWWSRPCRSTAADRRPSWATRCSPSGRASSPRTTTTAARRASLRRGRGVGGAGVGHDLPDPAPDAGAADRPDLDLRGQRARADPDPRPGRRGPARTRWASSTRSTS